MDPASSSGHGHTIATALDLRRVPSHTPHPAVIQGRCRQIQGATVTWSGLVGRVFDAVEGEHVLAILALGHPRGLAMWFTHANQGSPRQRIGTQAPASS